MSAETIKLRCAGCGDTLDNGLPRRSSGQAMMADAKAAILRADWIPLGLSADRVVCSPTCRDALRSRDRLKRLAAE